ncbi:ATP-binding cassette domain-containing protein [Nocardioides sp. GY 10127]|uniref:metal ABC transporter ATP-binding protein n=1 Tax=Nocardioides sp. GY 10127 TaxID=2569762 RepID=UPI0010A792F6|nr:ATP-binding cassette domain-containing protein [Nocardioides sp. GY 10127]TIC83961.1 ATP-binding cassette domain-containing protein [Nocardioides sp. GY 10127]
MPLTPRPAPHGQEGRAPAESAAPPVRLTGGAVALGGRPVLRGIDLTVAGGDFVALMGANGSGKSTLVRTLVGLLPLGRGGLELFGTDARRFRDWHRVGYVPQRGSAASGVPASVWEVVASGRLTRRRPLRPLTRTDRAAITDALGTVGMADRARDNVAQLSGGQQQRVLIARALAGEPELFFLDEPTAGVDLPHQEALADTLRVLKDRGSTIVLVAHELGPLAPLVDRCVVLRDGRVVRDGGPLTDAEVHLPWHTMLGGGTGHGHGHAPDGAVDHGAPPVLSPFDRPLDSPAPDATEHPR